ncbi:hypothetical protein GCM10027262_03820 [Nocardia tengchongensis]
MPVTVPAVPVPLCAVPVAALAVPVVAFVAPAVCADMVAWCVAAAGFGAVPQTVQYPSSMVPVQPGSVQFMIASPISAR